MLSGEAANTNIIVLGLTPPGPEPMIYRTWGQHTNYYTIDTVCFRLKIFSVIENENSNYWHYQLTLYKPQTPKH
jgi:hypothetical protein